MIDRSMSWKKKMKHLVTCRRMTKCYICRDACLQAHRKGSASKHGLTLTPVHMAKNWNSRILSMEADIHNSCSLFHDFKSFKFHNGEGFIREVSHCTALVVILRCPKQTIFLVGILLLWNIANIPNCKTWACRLLHIELFPKYTFCSTQTQPDRAVLALRESLNTRVILF